MYLCTTALTGTEASRRPHSSARDHAGPEDVVEAVDAHGDRHDAGVDVEGDLVSPSSTASISDTGRWPMKVSTFWAPLLDRAVIFLGLQGAGPAYGGQGVSNVLTRSY
ncbi:hypothetical protein PG984_007422 [Apiospora sp. TS-2023a]